MDLRIRIHAKMSWIRNTGLYEGGEPGDRATAGLETTVVGIRREEGASIIYRVFTE